MRKTAAGVAIVVGLVVAGAGGATAGPDNSGCPSGFEARTLTQWANDGYTGAPPQVDAPENGGNNDQIVCGRELGEGWEKRTGRVIYRFSDNDLPQ